MIGPMKTVGIYVQDQHKAVEFYTQTLGFEVRRRASRGGRGISASRRLVTLTAVGFTLCLQREWKGSPVWCITAIQPGTERAGCRLQ